MSSNAALAIDFQIQTSRLENLQGDLALGKVVTSGDILLAIEMDLNDQLPISGVYLRRLVISNPVFGRHQIKSLIKLLGIHMQSHMLSDPELFLNYAQAAALCAKNL